LRQSFSTGWRYPKAVIADGDGRITIGSNDMSGGLEQWREDGRGGCGQHWSHNPGRVRGLAALSEGRFCATVKTGQGYKVQVYDEEGALLMSWGRQGEEPGCLCNPIGIAANAAGHLYVVEATEWNGKRAMPCNRVQVFTADGRYLQGWGGTGHAPGQFNLPTGIAVAPDQSIWVADTFNSRLQHFTPEGVLLACWGHFGAAPGCFNCPQGVVVLADGTLLAVDTNNHRLQCVAAEDGAPRWAWGGPGNCWLPCGAALDAGGRLFVADTFNHRILVLGDAS